MSDLIKNNKKIRSEVKSLKVEFAALNGIYCELIEFISEGEKQLILSEVIELVTIQSGKEVQRYYSRNKDRMSSGRLEWDILTMLKQKNKA